MKIDQTVNNEEWVVCICGRLDTSTAPEFERYVAEHSASMRVLTLDCKDLEYISSAGLRVLLALQKKMKGAMKLTNVCEIVMEVFEMTGFADILVIE